MGSRWILDFVGTRLSRGEDINQTIVSNVFYDKDAAEVLSWRLIDRQELIDYNLYHSSDGAAFDGAAFIWDWFDDFDDVQETSKTPFAQIGSRMKIRVLRVDFYQIEMRTRFPFQYGIASLTELSHLFVHVTVEINGHRCAGIAADGLPPKWFTKNASTAFEDDDLPAMKRVIRQAADISIDLGSQPGVFPWWWQVYTAQQAWATENNIPRLLAGFGVSLIERAVIDAFCRQRKASLFDALRTDAFEIELELMRPGLGPRRVRDIMPQQALASVRLRHTVGLGDPITDSDMEDSEKIDDGLPVSLVECINAYNLTHFKIKLSGDDQKDAERLTCLAKVFEANVGANFRFTLDGNEQYSEIDAFRRSWQSLRSIRSVREMIDHGLLFVEQPLHRAHALDAAVKHSLQSWSDAPPIIIDESDADLGSFPTAIELGYSGTSHKNCKGVFKSVAAAATVAKHREQGLPLILSAEDLANVGPVALLQDLAVVGALGIEHVERNGHHYFAGLSMFPVEIQERVVERHDDLYHMNDSGFAKLTPRDGRLSLRSVNSAPFGLSEIPDLSWLEPWHF